MSSAPPTGDFVGYSTEEVRDFLEAVNRRIEELRSAIALATSSATRQGDAPDTAEDRLRVAGVWVAAHREAEMIRAQAEREARAIIDEAHRLAGEALTGAERLPRERAPGEDAATDPRW